MADGSPLWLFGDQLGEHFHGGPNAHRHVLLIESAAALSRHRYHRQKLHLMLYGIRRLAAELGDRATVVSAATYRAGLAKFGHPVVVHEPGSHRAAGLVQRLTQDETVQEIFPARGFLLARADFQRWAADRRRFVLEDFYRDQRRRFGVLVEPDGEPAGGRWNLDKDNRGGPPKQSTMGVAAAFRPQEDEIDDEVRGYLDRLSADGRINPAGADGPRLFAASRHEAGEALGSFLDGRLATFGMYQDAMLESDWSMSHALLSVPLNLGLLDPMLVVRAAESRYAQGLAPLNSVEGFIRQILGWREWVWHMYWHLGPGYLRRNELRAGSRLPRWWRDLDADKVTARCLSTALAGVRDRGYAHHIQRLMILGNHALQRGYGPRALTDWFATSFVDGFPWVMPANVIGMSQYADGGIVATKPYAAGGAYINRMSDSCRSCYFDPRQRLGARACPFTAGYWAFLDRTADRLRGNHRMAQPLRGLARLANLPDVVAQEKARTRF
ncbi:MAG: cryptochrome/photolyase family protein [Kibdelosporangium sp.]